MGVGTWKDGCWDMEGWVLGHGLVVIIVQDIWRPISDEFMALTKSTES